MSIRRRNGQEKPTCSKQDAFKVLKYDTMFKITVTTIN